MSTFVTGWLIAWLSTAAPPGIDPAQGVAQSPPVRPVLPVPEIQQTYPIRVVFIEHNGQYWTAGPVLARVRKYMNEHDLDGPMFIRYLNTAGGSPVGARCSHVGFIDSGDHQPEPPFQTVRWPRELVAHVVIEGRPILTRRDYTALNDWIKRNGYEVAGTITEIYELAGTAGTSASQRSEIRVTIDRDPAEARTRNVSTPVDPGETRPYSQPVVTGQTESVAGMTDDVGASGETATDPMAAPPATPLDDKVAAAPGAVEKDEVAVVDKDRIEPCTPPAARVRPVEPVRDLIATGRVDRIAEQLMPDGKPIPKADQVWFGQVVFRLRAVAKGIQRVYPGREQIVAAASNAITRRYRRISIDFQIDPLDQVVVAVDDEGDPLADRKRAITRDLDLLLGRIALGSIDAQAATNEFAAVLSRLRDTMQNQTEDSSTRSGRENEP